MKHKLTIFLFLSLQIPLLAQQNFEKRLCRNPDPVNSYCQMHSIVQLSNGGYITGGYNDYIHPLTGIDDVDALIFVTNPMGDTIKTHSFFPQDTTYYHLYNSRTINIFQSFIINKNNECIGVASIQGRGATNVSDCDILIVKMDSLGDTLLTKQISHPQPGDSAMIPYCIIQTYDNGYLIVGGQYSFTSNRYIGFVVKLNNVFNVLWRKSFLNPNSNLFYSVLESPNRSLFISGSKFDPNDYFIVDPFLLILDSVGLETSRLNFISVGPDAGGDIIQLSDGNFMQATTFWLAGLQYDTSAYRYIKFDINGNIISTKKYLRTYSGGVSLVRCTNGNVISAGVIENNHSTGTLDAFVMGHDNNGDSLWYRQYGGIWPDNAWDMAPTNDGGVILCGETYSNVIPNTNSNAWLLKLDSLGLLITSSGELEWASQIELKAPFPNPCSNQFSVTTIIPETENKGLGKTGNELQLYDLQSRPIRYISVKNGTSTTKLSTENLSDRNYLLVLVVNGYNVASQKVVVLK